MPESIKKVTVLATAITAALVLMTPALITTGAYAANPHFIGQPNCSVDSAGNLDCNGKIAGLGNVEEVQAFLEADIEATFGCDNPGPGIHIPPGQPEDFQDVPGEQETLAVRNGQTVFSLTIPAPQPSEGFDCPNPNWRIVLVSITYDNVSVIIDGDELPIGGPFSRTLIVV
jgi:hypothetical protein